MGVTGSVGRALGRRSLSEIQLADQRSELTAAATLREKSRSTFGARLATAATASSVALLLIALLETAR
ncbi:hypothetical protein MRX96_042978 [Rhipicephalus microplus]